MEAGTQGKDLEMNVLKLTPVGSDCGEGSSGASTPISTPGGDKAGKSD